jgi:hypothetical protein
MTLNKPKELFHNEDSNVTGDLHLSQFRDPNDADDDSDYPLAQKALFDSTPDDDVIDYDPFPFLRNDDNGTESPPNPHGSAPPRNTANIDQESEGNSKEQDNQINDNTGRDNGILKKTPFFTATGKHPLQPQKIILVNTKRKNYSELKKFQQHPKSQHSSFMITPLQPEKRRIHQAAQNTSELKVMTSEHAQNSNNIVTTCQVVAMSHENSLSNNVNINISNPHGSHTNLPNHKNPPDSGTRQHDKSLSRDKTLHSIVNPYHKQTTNTSASNTTPPNKVAWHTQAIPDLPSFANKTHGYNEPLQQIIIPHKKQALDNSKRSITLAPELESLRKVILSQHTALENKIKELGNTCLNFTTIIEKKKESASKIINETRTPRSLQIKCELTTSPSYETDHEFIELKKDLATVVTDFQSKGLAIMKKWSLRNIKLLTYDRCNNIMKQALSMLDGLHTYWSDIVGQNNWPQPIKDNLSLYLCKIYFDTNYIANINDVIEFLELPISDVLLIIAKILTKNNNDDFNNNIIDSLDIDFVNNATNEQETLIVETLATFDDIIQATTIQLWSEYSKKQKQIEASQKFKAKMEAEKITSATVATSKAINKAIANMNTNTLLQDATQLRIANLEKQLTQQNQTSKEILHHLRIQNQKNSNGSYHGSITSPPSRSTSHQGNIIDLTTTLSQSPEQHPFSGPITQKTKKQRIHWDSAQEQIQEFNPDSSPCQLFARSTTLNPFLPQPQHTLTNFKNTPPIPNPFLPPQNQIQRFRGGKHRGGRRGPSRKH